MDLARPYFSVVGDSISTFQAYSPVGAEHYAPDLASATGVASVEDTWWMQVIRTLGGAYLSNISISGNTICTEGKMGGFPPQRLHQLTAEGKTPDHILLYAGLNDVMFYIPPAVFQAEYLQLLTNLKQIYPKAQVHCGTLILGEIPGTVNSLRGIIQRAEPYNAIIRQAVAETGYHLVDLAALRGRYHALDAFHPNRDGMAQLAQLWLRAMK